MNDLAPAPRVALVTGAAGGLGQGLVHELLAQGWQVAAAWHRQNNFAETACLWPVQLEVTQADAVADTVEKIIHRWGRLDLLINNAGITADAPIMQMKNEAWERVLDVNLKGTFLCAQAALRPMCKQRSGHIINITSFAARAGTRGQANYAAAKAGLIGLTESLAREVGSRNVCVNAVLPGVLPTAMTADLPTETMAGFAQANALGRINSLAEVARFIVFLATMENVSGQIFQLDSRIARWT
jgi:3-oxoacyl-[acyl-carrier protein] reductase